MQTKSMAEVGNLEIPSVLEETKNIPYSKLASIEGYTGVTIYDMKGPCCINSKNSLH